MRRKRARPRTVTRGVAGKSRPRYDGILIGISCRRKASSSLKFDRRKVSRTEVGVDSVRTGDDWSAVAYVGTTTVSLCPVIPNTESTDAIDKSCEISLLGLCENFLPGRELPAVNRRGAPRRAAPRRALSAHTRERCTTMHRARAAHLARACMCLSTFRRIHVEPRGLS